MTELSISDALAERIEARVKATEFENADAYAEFVLSEVVTRVEHDGSDSQEATPSNEEVQDRLQSLGYLEE